MKVYFTQISKVLDRDQFGSARIDFERPDGLTDIYYPSNPHGAFHGMKLLNEHFNLGIVFEERQDSTGT